MPPAKIHICIPLRVELECTFSRPPLFELFSPLGGGIHIRDAPPVLPANHNRPCITFSLASGPAGSAAQGGGAYRLVACRGTDLRAAAAGGIADSAERPRESCTPAACLYCQAFHAAGQPAPGRGYLRESPPGCRRQRRSRCRKKARERSSRPATCQMLRRFSTMGNEAYLDEVLALGLRDERL